MKPRLFLFQAALLALQAPPLHAAISYATYGSTLTENFNTLSFASGTHPWADNSTIPGWYAATRLPAPSTPFSEYTASSGGTAAAGAIQSLGPSGNTDRALGSQNPNSVTSAISYGMSISNDTAGVISGFSLQYAGEQWRAISNEIADGITFDYQIFAAGTGTLDAASGWSSVSALTFTAPVTVTSSASVNGNTTGRVALASDVTGITWGQGQELWLRWSDNSSGGNRRAAVGIDDVSFTAIPEPTAAALGGLAALLLLGRRRS
ncbi:MAG: hypothetical protein EOP87_20045 [Verrucomicrobiaceae bacterium]|nr:MAG: hypothetical protein EOP87_20045 [Verrucomicrobiaceae bacterium]